MNFWNPYVGAQSPKAKGKANFPRPAVCPVPLDVPPRIIPLCFHTPGKSGVVFAHPQEGPICFIGKTAVSVLRPDGTSMWTHAEAPPSRHLTNLTFHVYDVIDTVYTAQQCDVVPFELQGDIIPSGCVIKLLGMTQQGQSVCVNVFGVKPYFYARAPQTVNVDFVLQQALRSSFQRSDTSFTTCIQNKKLLNQYDSQSYNVHKITLSSTLALHTVVAALRTRGCELYEAEVNAVSRFLVDWDFTPFGWYTCQNAQLRTSGRDAHTTFEFDCHVSDLMFHSDRSDWPTYRVMSFDIECIGESGFPNAAHEEDLITQISCVICDLGQDQQPRNILLTLGTCDAIADVEVYQFPSELDLLYAFLTLLRDGNIAFITGYNIANFDLPYILHRATITYNINVSNFTRVIKGTIFEVHQPRGEGASFLRAVSKIKMAGFVPIDMYTVCKDKLSLSNYKLDTVAQHCLNAQKEDVSYKQIPILFRSGPAGRAVLGKYCVKDSQLVLDLFKHFLIHIEASEIAKLAKLPVRRVLTDGQQVRIYLCLLAVARQNGYILPTSDAADATGYQGATVIDPQAGLYVKPVLVMDFASLYPSIIQRHNLCYTTLIPPGQLSRHPALTPDDYETFELSGGVVHFVKPHIKKSLLGQLLRAWLAKRKAIRKDMATCSDPAMNIILDKQQLAIKVTCNAVYGFTGVASGMLPCLHIAETVTLQGRTMLDKTKDFIEALTPEHLSLLVNFSVPHEPHAKFKVIYGDTDSQFVLCDGFSMETVQAFADNFASAITKALFQDPIKLEAEKIFQCLMLVTKKRYFGKLVNSKIVMKGVDLIRKTACRFVQDTCRIILDILLSDKDVHEAATELVARGHLTVYSEGLPAPMYKFIRILNQKLVALYTNSVPIEDLTFSTELSRPLAQYSSCNLPHLAVCRKLLQRNEEPPQVHDRIPYVFIRGSSKCKHERAEHPAFVVEHAVPIACDIYFDKLIHSAAHILQGLFGNDRDTTVAILYNFLSLPTSDQ